ncbi:hypothetical protein WN943_007502 [Citrus x changshan-huyou]
MESSVNICEEFESKKAASSRLFDDLHAQANSILVFPVQWKDLEEHFDLTMRSLEKQSNDGDMEIRLLDERAKEIESKESECFAARKY